MPKRLVMYDLHKPAQDYPDLWAALESYPHCRLQQSVWAIRTTETPKQVREKLKPYIDNDDKLLVSTLGGWAGFDPDDGLTCLKSL